MISNLLIILIMIITIGYVIFEFNKYQKGKSTIPTMINVSIYSLCFIVMCLLTLLKILSKEYLMYGVIALNLVFNFIEYKVIRK